MGFTGNFMMMLVFGAAVTAFVLFYLPETNKALIASKIQLADIILGYLNVLTNSVFVCNLLCAGLALSGLLAYAIISPFCCGMICIYRLYIMVLQHLLLR